MNSLHPRVDLRWVLAGALFAARRRGPVTVSASAAAVGRRGRYGRGGRRGRLRDGSLGGRRGTGHRAAGRPDRLHDDGGRRGPGPGRRGRGRGQVLRRADAVRRGRRRGGHLVLALDDAAAGRGRHADHVVVERRRYGRYGATAAGRGQTADAATAAAVVLQVLQVGARGRCGRGRLQPLVLLVLLVLLLVIDRVQLRVVDHGRRRLLHVLRRVLLRRVTAGRGASVVHAAAAAALGRLSVIVGSRGRRGAARAVARLQRVDRRRDRSALLLLGLLALLVAVHELIRTHVHLNGSGRARALR